MAYWSHLDTAVGSVSFSELQPLYTGTLEPEHSPQVATTADAFLNPGHWQWDLYTSQATVPDLEQFFVPFGLDGLYAQVPSDSGAPES